MYMVVKQTRKNQPQIILNNQDANMVGQWECVEYYSGHIGRGSLKNGGKTEDAITNN